jgi:hypothetical protein
MALAKDFPRLWNDPHTPQRERKRMARLLIADVTLLKGAELRAQVRFNGGATHTLVLEAPKSAWMLRQTPAAVVAEINRLLDEHTDGEVAELLNSQGMISGGGKRFNGLKVARIRIGYRLEDRYSRLRARGLLSLHEIAAYLDASPFTIKTWRRVPRRLERRPARVSLILRAVVLVRVLADRRLLRSGKVRHGRRQGILELLDTL